MLSRLRFWLNGLPIEWQKHFHTWAENLTWLGKFSRYESAAFGIKAFNLIIGLGMMLTSDSSANSPINIMADKFIPVLWEKLINHHIAGVIMVAFSLAGMYAILEWPNDKNIRELLWNDRRTRRKLENLLALQMGGAWVPCAFWFGVAIVLIGHLYMWVFTAIATLVSGASGWLGYRLNMEMGKEFTKAELAWVDTQPNPEEALKSLRC